MKANLTLNSENVIQNVITYPINENLPIIEIESLDEIHIGYDSYIDGKIVKNDKYGADQANAAIQLQIVVLKKKLAETDYKCLKYVDGALTADEYAEVKALRQQYRDQINELEASLTQQ